VGDVGDEDELVNGGDDAGDRVGSKPILSRETDCFKRGESSSGRSSSDDVRGIDELLVSVVAVVVLATTVVSLSLSLLLVSVIAEAERFCIILSLHCSCCSSIVDSTGEKLGCGEAGLGRGLGRKLKLSDLNLP